MLILSRKLGEQIRIGDDITVTVVEFRGSHVRIGITAPADVAVDRSEVREAKLRERYGDDDTYNPDAEEA